MFATIKSFDSRLKIVYYVTYYVAPIGQELEDQNHGNYFAFRGDQTKRSDPQIIAFLADML